MMSPRWLMSEFDPHASIKRLAEAERECPGVAISLPGIPGLLVHNNEKRRCCGGTGRIVPFASLRAPACPKVGQQPHWHFGVHFNKKDDCKQGWIPEPDVEKACFQVWKKLPNGIKHRLASVPYCRGANSWEEAVLRVAEAWLKEQKPRTHHDAT